MLFVWVLDGTQGDRGPDHDPMPGPLISEHHLGVCSGVKVNAVTSAVIAEPPIVVPEKSDLGIKMKLVVSPVCYLPGCSSYTATSLVFRGCFKPGLHLGTALASFFAGMT